MEKKQRMSLFDSVKGVAMIGIFMVHMGSWNAIAAPDSNWMRLIQRGALG